MMNECPICRGNKLEKNPDSSYTCLYCGSRIEAEKKEPTQKVEPEKQVQGQSPNVVYPNNVNVHYHTPPASTTSNQVAKGVAGGCLGGVLGIIVMYVGGTLFVLWFISELIRGCAGAIFG